MKTETTHDLLTVEIFYLIRFLIIISIKTILFNKCILYVINIKRNYYKKFTHCKEIIYTIRQIEMEHKNIK